MLACIPGDVACDVVARQNATTWAREGMACTMNNNYHRNSYSAQHLDLLLLFHHQVFSEYPMLPRCDPPVAVSKVLKVLHPEIAPTILWSGLQYVTDTASMFPPWIQGLWSASQQDAMES